MRKRQRSNASAPASSGQAPFKTGSGLLLESALKSSCEIAANRPNCASWITIHKCRLIAREWRDILVRSRGATVEMAVDQRAPDMCMSAFRRHLRGLAMVPSLVVMLSFPVSAQTNSDSWIRGSASARAQSELDRPLTSPNPEITKARPNNVAPATKTNAPAARVVSKATGIQPESNLGTKKAGSAVLINIDKANQKMTVFLDGAEKYNWPVSTGKAGYSTPSGTYTATSMNEIWYSKQWDNAPMPHSIFFMKDGHAIHGSHEVKNLGNPASHGCVRISPENAATLYALVVKNGLKNTQVVLTGTTPGGEFKVASPAGAESRYSQADFGGYRSGDNYYTQPRTRLDDRFHESCQLS
jgi:lipoprotein-anchoring transpeptidase ErfK/SrfK